MILNIYIYHPQSDFIKFDVNIILIGIFDQIIDGICKIYEIFEKFELFEFA